MRVLALAVLTGFGLRIFLHVPRDAGGLFWQIWNSLGGLGYLVGSQEETFIPRKAVLALLPIGCFLVIAPVFYSPLAYFPFLLLVGFLITGAWLRKRKNNLSILAFFLSAIMAGGCIPGVRHMLLVMHIRHLHANQVMAISLSGQEVNSREFIADFVDALHYTSPYTPTRETQGLDKPRNIVIEFANGRSVSMIAAQANGASHPTARIVFSGQAEYQNARLYLVLTHGLDTPLWRSPIH